MTAIAGFMGRGRARQRPVYVWQRSRCAVPSTAVLVLFAVVGLQLISPARAWAQGPTERAVVLFDEARRHYNLGQYELAADKFAAAIRADPSLPGPYRNLGLTYRALDKCDLALPHFRKYLQLRPNGRHAARVKKEIQYCKGRVGPQERTFAPIGEAQMVVRVSVEGAKIYIDGLLRGASPCGALPVKPGKHTVSVVHEEFLHWTKGVEVRKGEVAAVDVDLEPDLERRREAERRQKASASSQGRGWVRLLGLPPGTSVFVDGRAVLSDDQGRFRVLPGEQKVQVEGFGWKTWERTIRVRQEATTTVLVNMEMTKGGHSIRHWGWVSVVASAGLGVAGAVLGLMENRTLEDIKDFDRTSGSRSALNDLESRRRSLGVAANVMYGVGVAALAGGIVLFTLGPEETDVSHDSRLSGLR
jgi:hypothetical protein